MSMMLPPEMMGGGMPPGGPGGGGLPPAPGDPNSMAALAAILGGGGGGDPGGGGPQLGGPGLSSGLGGGDPMGALGAGGPPGLPGPDDPGMTGDVASMSPTDHIRSAIKHLMMAMTQSTDETETHGITKGLGTLQGILAGKAKASGIPSGG